MKCNSQYKPVIRKVERISPANPYKWEKKKDEWTKICEKYNEEDKSKPPKKGSKNE